jgi:hypothetical protein
MLTVPESSRLSGSYWSISADARLYLFGEGAPEHSDHIWSKMNEDYRFLAQQLERLGHNTVIDSLRVIPMVARTLWKLNHLWVPQFVHAKEVDQCILVENFSMHGRFLPLHIVRATAEHRDFEFNVLNFPGEPCARLRGKPDEPL